MINSDWWWFDQLSGGKLIKTFSPLQKTGFFIWIEVVLALKFKIPASSSVNFRIWFIIMATWYWYNLDQIVTLSLFYDICIIKMLVVAVKWHSLLKKSIEPFWSLDEHLLSRIQNSNGKHKFRSFVKRSFFIWRISSRFDCIHHNYTATQCEKNPQKLLFILSMAYGYCSIVRPLFPTSKWNYAQGTN